MKILIACLACILALILLPACAPPRATATPPASAGQTLPPGARTAAPNPRETVEVPTDEPLPADAFPTARPHLYDEVDEPAILAAVFPNLKLDQVDDRYQVQDSQDWQVWVNDRDEGFITQNQRSELIVIIGSELGPNPPKEASSFGPSSSMLAILEKQNGKLVVTYRQPLAPVSPPSQTDMRFERTVDIDHNGTDEILLTSSATQSAIAHIEAHLFKWDGNKLTEVWKGVEQDDNTGAPPQDQYYSYQAIVDFQDVDHDGKEEILVNGERIIYNKDANGDPDFSNAQSILADRQVFRWNGKTYEPDKALTTPPAPEPTP